MNGSSARNAASSGFKASTHCSEDGTSCHGIQDTSDQNTHIGLSHSVMQHVLVLCQTFGLLRTAKVCCLLRPGDSTVTWRSERRFRSCCNTGQGFMHHDASSEAWGEEEAADAATAVTCMQKAIAACQHSQALSFLK